MSVFSLIEGALNLLDVLHTAYREDRDNAALIQPLRSRVLRIQTNLTLYNDLPCSKSLFTFIEDRVVSNFSELVSQLQQIEAKRERNVLRRLLTAGYTAEHMRKVRTQLDELERHLEMFGLMKNLQGSFDEQANAIGSELRLISDRMPAMENELQQIARQMQDIAALVAKVRASDFRHVSPSSAILATEGWRNPLSVPDESLDRNEKENIDMVKVLPARLKQLSVQVGRSTISPADKAKILNKFKGLGAPWNLNQDDIVFDVDGRNRRRIILGKGGFSIVFRATLQLRSPSGELEGNSIPVAAKQLKLSRQELSAFKSDVLREMFLLTECAHPCILHTYGASWPSENCSQEAYSPPVIVTELMTDPLEDALESPSFDDIGVKRAVLIDVAKALVHLHRNNIVHRDVKPSNVLVRIVNGELVRPAKLSDLGVSKTVHQATLQRTYATSTGPSGTIAYMPPEVLCNLSRCVSRRSWDVWSFGMLACVVAGRKDAFHLEMTAYNAPAQARDGRLAHAAQKWADSISDRHIRITVKKCLNADYSERMPMEIVPSMLMPESADRAYYEGREAFFRYWISGERYDGVRAAESFEVAWHKGTVKAAHWFGYCQQLGLDGCWIDSLRTYERGSAQGDPMCKLKLSEYYLFTTSPVDAKEKAVRAVEMLREASDAGNVVASFWLSKCFLDGFVVTKDDGKARRIREKAAVSAGRVLGLLDERRLDDLEKGDLLFEKVAWENCEERKAGLCKSAVQLGNFDAWARLFSGGDETTGEIGRLTKFGCNGTLRGMVELGTHLLWKAEPKRRQGFALLVKAANIGFGVAQYFVGKCHEHGVGVARSASTAEKYFRAARRKYGVTRVLEEWWHKNMPSI